MAFLSDAQHFSLIIVLMCVSMSGGVIVRLSNLTLHVKNGGDSKFFNFTNLQTRCLKIGHRGVVNDPNHILKQFFRYRNKSSFWTGNDLNPAEVHGV